MHQEDFQCLAKSTDASDSPIVSLAYEAPLVRVGAVDALPVEMRKRRPRYPLTRHLSLSQLNLTRLKFSHTLSLE